LAASLVARLESMDAYLGDRALTDSRGAVRPLASTYLDLTRQLAGVLKDLRHGRVPSAPEGLASILHRERLEAE
jgi:hypothetical protein